MSQVPARHNGNGHPSNGGQSPPQAAYLEQMLELVKCQTIEMQRLAALAVESTAKRSALGASRPKSSR
jgi:hypothetical protein